MYSLHDVFFLFLVVLVALSLMMLAGIEKRALEPRRARRICPSCGRETRDCACGR